MDIKRIQGESPNTEISRENQKVQNTNGQSAHNQSDTDISTLLITLNLETAVQPFQAGDNQILWQRE